MKEMKRVLALLLCFVMLVGYVPVGAFATEEDVTAPSVEETIATEATDAAEEITEASEIETSVPEETETDEMHVAAEEADSSVFNLGNVSMTATGDSDYVDAALFFSDLHVDKTEYAASNYSPVDTVFGSIAAYSGLDFSSVTSVGDAYAVNGSTSSSVEKDDGTFFDSTTAGLTAAIEDALDDKTGFDMNYVWSDHDRKSDIPNESGLVYSGDNYYIYAISMADTSTDDRYKTKQFSSYDEVAATIAEFTTLVNETLDHTKPLFIVSHQPLLDRRNDNGRAAQWYPAINAAGEKMDIVFLFGHNHNYDQSSDYYWAKGQTMPVEGISNPDPLTFTHACAGYLNPTTSNTGTRKGTAVVAEIDKDAIYLTTYNESGVYAGDYSVVNKKVDRAHGIKTVSTTMQNQDKLFATGAGLTGITAEWNDTDLSDTLNDQAYSAYDVTLAGYTSGNVTVSMDVLAVDVADVELYYVNSDGSLTAITPISVEATDYGVFVTFTAASGSFSVAVGNPASGADIPEGAVLTGLTVKREPEKKYYFPEEDTQEDGNMYLEIDGLEIAAVYTHEGKNYEKVLDWNEFGKVEGYGLTFNLTTVGEKAVTVSYGDQTAEFVVYVCAEDFDLGNVQVHFTTPGVTALTAAPAAVTETITAALSGLLTGTLAVYDFTPVYPNPDAIPEFEAEITLPIPAGVTDPQVYYISDQGAVEAMPTENNGDGTMTFTTTHFSVFVGGQRRDDVTVDNSNSVKGTGGLSSAMQVTQLRQNVPYWIVADRGHDAYLTNETNGNGLLLDNDRPAEDLWYWDGTYIRYAAADSNQYLRVWDGHAAIGNASSNNRVNNVRGNNSGLFTLQAGGYYLNRYGSQTSDWAAGYFDDDAGSQWKFYTNYVEFKLQNPADMNVGDAAQSLVYEIIRGDGATVNLNNSAITWSSNNTNVVTVSNGVLTPVGAGTAEITATLSRVNGTNLTENITLRVPVTVISSGYTLEIVEPESLVLNPGTTLDLNAIIKLDGRDVEGTVTWSIPEDQQTIATVDADGKVTPLAEGDVTVTATYTDPDGEIHTDTITLNVHEPEWSLDLCQPIWAKATEFVAGETYYTYNEATREHIAEAGVTAENFGQKEYFVMTAVTSIDKPIVLKNVTANQSFVDLWAVIYKDGLDIGKLSDAEMENLTFVSSNAGIAEVNQNTGKVTFKGNKGTVSITAIYEYEDGKSVQDTVTFSISPSASYYPEDGTDDFPEYPNEGAIRFDKTATAVGSFSQTGIAKMELSMTGVPYSRGVDVIVMLDLSSSMKRCIAHNDSSCKVNGCKTRRQELEDSMEDLQTILRASDNAENIRIAVADFNNFYTSSNSPYYRHTDDRTEDVGALGNDNSDPVPGHRVYTGNGRLDAGAFVSITDENLDVTNFAYTPSRGTNYDYAFDAIYQLGHAIKEANGEEQRDLVVIFMSDGAPNQYNYYGSTGGSSLTDTRSSEDWNYWLTGTIGTQVNGSTVTMQSIVNNSAHYYFYDAETGNQHRMANAVRGNPEEQYEIIRKATTGLADVMTPVEDENGNEIDYLYEVPGLGAIMYSVAFDISNDGRITAESVEHVLKNIPTGGPDNLDYYFEADEEGALQEAFGEIAGQIVEAAKDVKVTDKMDEHFTMVFDAPNEDVANAVPGQEFYIEFLEYPLNPVYENNDPDDDIIDYVRDTQNAVSKIKIYLGINNGNPKDTYYAATAANSKNNANKFAAPRFYTTPIGTKRYWVAGTNTGDSDITVTDANGNDYSFVSTGNGTHNIASGASASGSITRVEITDKDNPVQNEADKKYNSTSTDLIIATPYFVYNAATKLLIWTTEKLATTEYAMNYFLYLDKSGGYSGMDGETLSGSYKTNEYAVMQYKNYKGNECEVEFPRPQITWNGAQVTYVFYLVNNQGQPVNRAGTVVPFSEAVYVTDPATYTVVWNTLEQISSLDANYLAESKVPDVFRLYDPEAKFNIHVFENEAEQNLNNHFVIHDTSASVDTTYVFNAKADVDKYKTPGTYSSVGGNYLCKDYEGVSGVVRHESINNMGDLVVTYTGGSYTGDESKQYKDVDGNAVYGIDELGMYTIITKSGATKVHNQFDFHNTTVAFAVVWTPDLVPDTVVVDYGLDVVIDVTRNDTTVPGVVGVRADAPAGVAMNNGQYTAAKNQITDVKIGNVLIGRAAVENKNAVRFTMDRKTGMQFTQPAVFYYEAEVQYTNNEGSTISNNLYSSVTVIPATTVYYEEDYVTFTNSSSAETVTDENGNEITYGAWTNVGEMVVDTQDVDRPGEDRIGESYDADNVYGYDSAYDNMATYSMGGAKKTTVSKGKSAMASFDFYGTGFDVISMTTTTTGTIIVQVLDANNTIVRRLVVDTYYGMLEDGTLVPNTPDALYQVPVMKVIELPYGKYTAKIVASYDPLFDHDKGGSYEFYLDAIRIYDPIETNVVVDNKNTEATGDDVTVGDIYAKDNEAWPVYHELRNILINADGVTTTTDADGKVTVNFPENDSITSGAIFIDARDETYSIETYTKFGPNNELYLAKNQAVSFSMNLAPYIRTIDGKNVGVADVQIGMMSADGNAVKVKLFVDGDEISTAEIKSATDMHYSVGAYCDLMGQTILTLQNVGESGIISITDVKLTFDTKEAPEEKGITDIFPLNEKIATAMVLSLRRAPVVEETPEPTVPEESVPEETEPEVTEPEVTEPEETEPEVTEPEETLDADLQVNIRNKNIKAGSSVVVKATTSSDVDALTVNGERVSRYTENRRTGVRTWSINVKAEKAGDMDIEVTAYSAEGQALDTVVEQITVTGKKTSIVEQIIGIIIGVLLR